VNGDVQVAQLLRLPLRPGASVMRSVPSASWKGDHVAQRLRSGEQEGEPVHPSAIPPCGGAPIPQRLEEEPELLLRFLGRDAHGGEDLFLHRRIVQPDGTAGDLETR